jgi:hypothetical protein
MIVIGGLFIGAALGILTAKKRGGTTADLLQYGAVYAIAFALLGLVVTLVLDRAIL